MARCTSCGRYFDQDDFMSDECEGSTLCPDCYFGGGAIEDDEEIDYDQEGSELDLDDDIEDEDDKILKEFFGDEMDQDEECDDFDDDEFVDELDEFEDRLDAEEGDYE